jgi:hypothetical protein
MQALAQVSLDSQFGRGRVYGAGINSDVISNTPIGGDSLFSVDYRFRTVQGDKLDSIRIWVQWDTSGNYKRTYSAGTGGTLVISLEEDDGTAFHFSNGTELYSLSLSNLYRTFPEESKIRKLNFPSPTLKANTYYHLVFRNGDLDSKNNYVSLNSLVMFQRMSPTQPSISDSDWLYLRTTSPNPHRWVTTGWQFSPNWQYTPVAELIFDNGSSIGLGYQAGYNFLVRPIAGADSVREYFVPNLNRKVTSVSVRLRRQYGLEKLTIRILDSFGRLHALGTVPATSLPIVDSSYGTSLASWVKCTFPLPVKLDSGTGYYLVLSCPPNGRYDIFPVIKGFFSRFKPNTYFADGYAQFWNNESWVGWTVDGHQNTHVADLQFYFQVQSSSTTDSSQPIGYLGPNFELYQNYPNPFNGSTNIDYLLQNDARISIEVIDLSGRRVALLFEGVQTAGYHHVVFIPLAPVSAGLYFCRLRSASYSITRKLLFLK